MIEGGHLAEIYCIIQWKMLKGEGGPKKMSYILEKINYGREGVLTSNMPPPGLFLKYGVGPGVTNINRYRIRSMSSSFGVYA